MTADNFRDIALSLPGAVEGAHMGHPDFRAGGRIFASLQVHERSGTVKLTPLEQREFIRVHPKVFAPAPGAWGRQGWTEVRLSEADIGTARAAIMVAWQSAADPPPSPPSSKRRTTRAARPSRKRRS